jgi:hypothetical protein
MRIRRELRLVWERDHNVASLFLTADDLSGALMETREIGEELVLHYDAERRCVEAEFLDPESCLPPGASAETALRIAFEILASPTAPEEAG